MRSPDDAVAGEALLALLTPWLAVQRWFPGKGDAAPLDPVRELHRLPLPAGPGAGTFLILVVAAGPDRLALQLPLSVYPAADPERTPIGVLPDGRVVCDGLADPAFLRAWVAIVAGERPAPELSVWTNPQQSVLTPAIPPTGFRPVGAEQSNSSVVFTLGERQLIAKFFRRLHPGSHPEVDLGQALAHSGTPFAPTLHAAVTADAGALCVIHTFLAGGEDGWELALAAAGSGADFTAEAHAIGVALARIHGSLRHALGAGRLTDRPREEFIEAIIARLSWAWETAGGLVGDYGPALRTLFAQLRAMPDLPAVQRIHGDLHLGQLMRAPARGGARWQVLDFEGEPLRPLSDRALADVPLRDVVGMLRSFDYAAAQATRGGGVSAATAAAWSRRCEEAFLRGYDGGGAGAIAHDSPLFMALWLDKALYEVVYERSNRPDWLAVPVRAVREFFQTRERSADMAEKTAPLSVDTEVLAQVSHGSYYAPHSVLGAHLTADADGVQTLTIRTLRHLAQAVSVRTAHGSTPMEHEHGGVWVAVVPLDEPGHAPDYRLEVTYADGVHRVDDPYRYLPTVGELDLHLISEGRHESLWAVLGAHVRRYHSALGEEHGVGFAVWAPGVRAVRVVGEFNGWDGRAHAMRSLGTSGVWELFIPGVAAGARYKYELLTAQGQWLQKADPMAYGTEVPPLTASRVVESSYAFGDQEWMAARAARDPHTAPMSTYEVHLGSWRLGLDYRQLAKELTEYVAWMGFTHVELMPVAEHPFGGSWGYQVTSYYAPTARFGHPDEFRYLVDTLHQHGIGVIMDWVPAHFPKDSWALAKFTGVAQYEHADPQLGEHPDWGTLIFDFGRNEVRNFLVANALFWLEEFHIDGLRVDAVASMLYLDYSREDGQWSPNRHGGRENLEAVSFLQEMNATAYRRNPGIVTIAEESTAFPGVTAPTSAGGLGFGIKWNMGWMHDSLTYMAEDPVNRGWHHNQITFSLVYAFTENFMLPISHDEVVHGKGSLLRKMPGDRWQQLANLRAYLAFQWAHPGKQLIFMGTEFAQESEWSEQHGLDWWLAENPAHRGIQLLVKELNTVYATVPALFERDNEPAGFSWINGGDTANNVVSFIRWDNAGEPVVCVFNFAGVAYENFRIGVPAAGDWAELLNTDAAEFGGSDVRNGGALAADGPPWDGQEHSVALRVPPLGALYLRPRRD